MAHPDLTLRQQATADTATGGTDLYLTCRNAAHLLPHFLHHYRALGVERFCIIDNASTDETTALVHGTTDVTLYYTAANYFDAGDGRHWVNALVAAAPADRWSLWVDTDELLVYPGYEHIALPALTRALDDLKATGLYAFMLDCYGAQLFDTAPYVPPTPFATHAPWFDATGYQAHYVADREGSPKLRVHGGVRHRVLDWSDLGHRPRLSKLPLVKNDGSEPWLSSHKVTERRLCGITGVLLHYPFLGQSLDRLREDIAAGGRGGHQPVYEKYVRAMDGPALSAIDSEISQRYRSSAQLIELGLIALGRAGLRALRQTLPQDLSQAERRARMAPLRQAQTQAETRFTAAPGHLFQVTDRY